MLPQPWQSAEPLHVTVPFHHPQSIYHLKLQARCCPGGNPKDKCQSWHLYTWHMWTKESACLYKQHGNHRCKMSVMVTNEDEERALQCSLHVVTEKVLYGQVWCFVMRQGKAPDPCKNSDHVS